MRFTSFLTRGGGFRAKSGLQPILEPLAQELSGPIQSRFYRLGSGLKNGSRFSQSTFVPLAEDDRLAHVFRQTRDFGAHNGRPLGYGDLFAGRRSAPGKDISQRLLR